MGPVGKTLPGPSALMRLRDALGYCMNGAHYDYCSHKDRHHPACARAAEALELFDMLFPEVMAELARPVSEANGSAPNPLPLPSLDLEAMEQNADSTVHERGCSIWECHDCDCIISDVKDLIAECRRLREKGTGAP